MTTPGTTELDTFDPIPETVKLSTGSVVRILDLKTRQFFRLLRIITRGAGGFLMQSNISVNDDISSFVAKLMGVLIVAVPEAENETIDFLLSMTEPDGIIDRPNLDKGMKERNDTLWAEYNAALANPELDDFVDILEAIVKREAADIQSLGKRLQTMFTLAQRTGQLTPTVSEQSAPSEQPSTTDASTQTDSSAGSATPST